MVDGRSHSNAHFLPRSGCTCESVPEVHIWCFRTDVPREQWELLEGVLPDDERAKAARFRFAPDRVRYIVSHASLRRLIGSYAAVPPQSLRFRTGAYGKPYVVEPAEATSIQFNLSHSGQYVAIALAFGMEIGLDMEEVRRDVSYEELTDYWLTEREKEWLSALPPEKRLFALYRLWTAKECAVKAYGAGLSISLSEVEVSDIQDRSAIVNISDPPGTKWFITSVSLAEGYESRFAVSCAETVAKTFYPEAR